MIVYKDVLERLKSAGYTTYRIRAEGVLPQKTMTALRSNAPVTTKTIDTICRLAGCQPGDIMAYVPDPTSEE